MIIGSYVRTYDDAKGLVTVTATNSDLQGASIEVLTRYTDERPDRKSGWDGLADWKQALRVADEWFNKEISTL